jgi:hypothetical protein
MVFSIRFLRGIRSGISGPGDDTTGCGDAILAGLLCGVVFRNKKPEAFTAGELSSMCRYANAVGASAAVPAFGRVERFLIHGKADFAG